MAVGGAGWKIDGMNASPRKHGHDLTTSNGLSLQRTRFASERTLMAWVRTAFSMITFGFSLVKFFQYLRGEHGDVSNGQVHYLGLAMILVGVTAISVGISEHWGLLKSLHEVDGSRRDTPALYIAVVVGLLGVSAFVSALIHTHAG
jgi:putative membrane protein